jgi:acetylglutamate/LysW-gamma-L-alpha-aminoadipate kinase
VTPLVTLVVKIGGAAGNAADPLLREVAKRSDCVLVHGGSDEVDRLSERLGVPSRTFTSPSGVVSRHTDATQLEVVVLALPGAVQTRLVAGLTAVGARAVGLSGVDGRLLRAHRTEGAREVVEGRVLRLADDRSGRIEAADPTLLQLLLTAGYLPVVGPPAVSATGEVLNVDADRAAAAIAIALGATDLVLLTNVAGLLRDPSDPASCIPTVARDGIEEVLPLAQGRMRKKVLAAQEALRGGVGRAVIARSDRPEPIASALAGEGTTFR